MQLPWSPLKRYDDLCTSVFLFLLCHCRYLLYTNNCYDVIFFFHKCSFSPCFPMYSSPLPRARTICSDAPSFTRWGRNRRLSMLWACDCKLWPGRAVLLYPRLQRGGSVATDRILWQGGQCECRCYLLGVEDLALHLCIFYLWELSFWNIDFCFYEKGTWGTFT